MAYTSANIELELMKKKVQYLMFVVQFVSVGPRLSPDDRAKLFEITKTINLAKTDQEAKAGYDEVLAFAKKF